MSKKGKKNKGTKKKKIIETKYMPIVEEIVDLLITQRNYPKTTELLNFFRVLTINAMAKVPSMLHCKVNSPLYSNIPINTYVAALAVSGLGKNRTVNTLDNRIFKKTYDHILNLAMVDIQEVKLREYANTLVNNAETMEQPKSSKTNNAKAPEEPEEELDGATSLYYKLEAQLEGLGEYYHKFDTATSAAIRQMCTKIQLMHCGSLNLFIDELAMSISNSTEALKEYLTLYDEGILGKSLLKNTKDNTRIKSPDIATPANLLMIGTPHNLLDGSINQSLWEMLLSTGYARRSLFAYVVEKPKAPDITTEDLYIQLATKTNTGSINKLSNKLYSIASKFKGLEVLNIDTDADIELLQFSRDCAESAAEIPNESALLKIHVEHRYFPAVKLAGILAFWDGCKTVQLRHVKWAINYVNDSTDAFSAMIQQPKDYERVVEYLAQRKTPASTADLFSALAFYPKSKTAQQDLMKLATAYARGNNCILENTYEYDIEYFNVIKLDKFKGKKIPIAYSIGLKGKYQNKKINVKSIENLINTKNLYFINHNLKESAGGKRKEEYVEKGTAMICLDIDEGIGISTIQLILQEYTYVIYTTKSSTKSNPRFRVILFLDHFIKLNAKDYKQFMLNIFDFLPFIQDNQVAQRNRAWGTNPKGKRWFNKGKYFPVFNFIPRTKDNEEHTAKLTKSPKEYKTTHKVEYWFINQAEEGNRNNTLFRYRKILEERGLSIDEITEKVLSLNEQFTTPITVERIEKTVLNFN